MRVEFHFDFGSPNAYLSHVIIPRIEQRTGAKFEYVPILLGGVFKLTNNRSPVEATPASATSFRTSISRPSASSSKHGITNYQFNPFFPVNTLALMRGAVAAQRMGVFARYVDQMFRHMWVQPKEMDDPEVLRAALQESGFDAAKLMALAQEQISQGRAGRQHITIGRARHVRRADVLRRRRHLLRQGPIARRRRSDHRESRK